jgi:hypothetical protein
LVSKYTASRAKIDEYIGIHESCNINMFSYSFVPFVLQNFYETRGQADQQRACSSFAPIVAILSPSANLDPQNEQAYFVSLSSALTPNCQQIMHKVTEAYKNDRVMQTCCVISEIALSTSSCSF